MARLYPKFLFSDPQNTKSKGPFIVHTTKPQFIAKVYKVQREGQYLPILDIVEKWDDDNPYPVNFDIAENAMTKWFEKQLRCDFIELDWDRVEAFDAFLNSMK